MDGGPGKKDKKKAKPGSFQGLGLSQPTYKAVMRMGYKLPTPIQRKTIPTILGGEDLVAMARTGSGKTAAFLIPIIERLGTHSVTVGTRAVILSPTRELAMQTCKFMRQLGRYSGLRCCLLVGGQAMETQFEHLAANPDVVVATPGRLAHHMTEAELTLAKVDILVFDEADRLFELGFAEQLQKVLDAVPVSRQVLLFSATLPSQLVSFTRSGIKNPVFVRLDVDTTLSDSLELWYLYVRKDEKLAAAVATLRRLYNKDKTTIFFVATKHHVEFFHDLLTELGLTCAMVYGNMDQDAREAQVRKFRKRHAKILVTTDVAARGIDIPLLDHVVNYDFPPSAKLFVHRSGRTARAGRSGLSVSLVTLEDLPYCMELMVFLGCKIAVATKDHTVGMMEDGKAPPPCIGSVPGLENEVETLNGLINDTGSYLHSSHKSMVASYHLYNKTRPAASKQSCQRSRDLLEECGGPARLQGIVHPAFSDMAGSSGLPGFNTLHTPKSEQAGHDFIQMLRGYRPQAAKIGNVLSETSTRFMEQSKKNVAGTREAEAHARGLLESGALDKDESDSEAEKATKKGGSKRKKLNREDERPARSERPRMSKRQRQKGGKGEEDAEDFDGFDVKVDGQALGKTKSGDQSSAVEKPKKVEQFYLTVERDRRDEAKETGLAMESYQMDMIEDEGGALKKQKSVIRWDAKKKKYLPVMISADGRVVKGSTRNESGKKVKGEADKSKIYKQWAKTSKKRIQRAGEMEEFAAPIGMKQAARIAAEQAKTIAFDNDGEVAKEDTSSGRKPIVPFHGKLAAKDLTHKQKRQMKKRESNDRIMKGPANKEDQLKSMETMKKEKKLRQQNKLKQKPFMRKEKAQAAKKAYADRREDRQMKHGARTKSKMLIFEGPPKARNKGMNKLGFLKNNI